MLSLLTQVAASCGADKTFLGIIPTWYKYIPLDAECGLDINLSQHPEHLWLIGFGILDMLLRVAGIVAVSFVIVGGVKYITSQGEPDGTKAAQQTVINALIGLAIAISASAFVGFVAGRFN